MLGKFTITVVCPATGEMIDFDINRSKDYDWHVYDKRLDSGGFRIYNDWTDAVRSVLSIKPTKRDDG